LLLRAHRLLRVDHGDVAVARLLRGLREGAA
jgi:hypothetical protein